MDNLTHTLLGAALAKTPLGRRSPLSAAALIVGANLPDLDVISGLWSQSHYLVYHRGITHSLLGCVVEIVLLGLLFRWLERRFFPERGGSPWLAVIVGVLSHPLLDLTNTYGLRPWLPFSERWIYGDLFFIVDPWLWLIFGSATFLAGGRSRWGDAAFLVFLLGTSALVCLHSRAPSFAGWVWIPAMAVLAAARWLRWGENRPNRVLLGAAAALAVYGGMVVGFREAARGEAKERVETQLAAGESIDKEVMNPRPMQAWSWVYIAQTARNVYASGWPQPERSRPLQIARRLDDPRVARAAADPSAFAWKIFARIPWAWVVESEGQTRVFLLDARYQLHPAPSWAGVEIELR